MGRRESKREETRQQILSAAAALFSAHGYASSSIDDIARAADVARGTLYYNFESKEDIVFALRHRSFDVALADSRAALERGEKPLDILEQFLVKQAGWAENNRELAQVLYGQGPLFPRPPAKDLDGKELKGPPKPPPFFEIFQELVTMAQKAGDLRADVDPDFVAHLIGFTGMHSNISWARHDMQGSPVDLVKHNYKALLSGLGQS